MMVRSSNEVEVGDAMRGGQGGNCEVGGEGKIPAHF